MVEMTPKQERFCAEYLIDLNATQAAIRAGYSKKTAQEQASRLLSNVMVQGKILELKKPVTEKLGLEADWVLSRYQAIADFRIEDIMDFNGVEATFKPLEEWTLAARMAVQSIKQTITEHGGIKEVRIEFKIEDRQRALESIGRYLGMFDCFETALRTLKTYGINMVRDEDGKWMVDNGDE
jgi:phage terminase small subunit